MVYVKYVAKFLLCLIFMLGEVREGRANEMDFPEGLLKVTKAMYRSPDCRWMLTEEEPASVLSDPEQRSFYVNAPLQVRTTKRGELFLRFYSPRPLGAFILWIFIEERNEEYKLAEFDTVLPFAELCVSLPGGRKRAKYETRSGGKAILNGKQYFCGQKLSFRIECKDPYFEKLSRIRCNWHISFANYSGPRWTPLLPAYAREAVAIALNMAYLFSTPEFERSLLGFQGRLYADPAGTQVDVKKLYRRILQLPALRYSCVRGVNGLGGGSVVGLAEWCYCRHYADNQGITHTLFHEFAHCLGYGHQGNMTYENGLGKGWVALCGELYRKMCKEEKLPVYSSRFLATEEKENDKTRVAGLTAGNIY